MCLQELIESDSQNIFSKPTCPVCLEDLLDIEKQDFNFIRKFECGHLICFLCYSKIKIVNISYKKKCPVCRHVSLATLVNYNCGKCPGCEKQYAKFSHKEKMTFMNSCAHIFCKKCLHDSFVPFKSWFRSNLCPICKIEHGGMEQVFFN
jgi:hypothetical protein